MSKWPRLTEKISKLTCYQLDPSEVERVAGNAPFAAKELVLKMFYTFCTAEGEFSSNVAKLIRIVQVDVDRTPEMPTLGHAKVVCEMTVEEDTSNTTGHIHAGCAMFLVDICTEMPLIAWKAAERRVDAVDMGVSHSINTIFHSPAPLGTKLRIVSTTLITEGQILSGRCQIWDVVNHRLVVTGTQTKMAASSSRQRSRM